MSSIPVSTHPACAPWCDYRTEPDFHDSDYCTHAVTNRLVTCMGSHGCYVQFRVSRATARLPLDTPSDKAYNAARHHADVVQVEVSGIGFEELVTDLQPGDARSLGAALIHGADLAEGLVR